MKRSTLDRLLPALVSDLAAGTLTTQSVGTLLTAALGGTDASGAWTWRQAYDLVQAAAIIADRDTPLASDPVTRLGALTAAASRPADRDPALGDADPAPAILDAPALCLCRLHRRRDPARRRGAGAVRRHRRAGAHGSAGRRKARPQRDRPVPRHASRRGVPPQTRPARRRAYRRPPRPRACHRCRGDEPALLVFGLAHRSDDRAAPCRVGRQAALPRRAAGGDPADGGLRGSASPRSGGGSRRSSRRACISACPASSTARWGRTWRRRFSWPTRPCTDVGVGESTIPLRPMSLQDALAAVRTDLPARPPREARAPVPGCACRAATSPSDPARPLPVAAPRCATRAAVDAPLAYVERATPGQNVAVSDIYPSRRGREGRTRLGRGDVRVRHLWRRQL